MEDLAGAALAGSRGALFHLFEHLHPLLLTAAQGVLGSHADVDDAVQEALIAIDRGLPNFEGRSSLQTWATGIAIRKAVDILRARKARRLTAGGLDTVADDAWSAEAAPERDPALAAVLERVLAGLDDAQRVTVLLRFLDDMELHEIAETMHCPVPTVASRLRLARRHLRRYLEPLLGTLAAEPG